MTTHIFSKIIHQYFRYILDNPSIVKGKRVLDFGSGSGAIAIAALKSGATTALANDIDPGKMNCLTSGSKAIIFHVQTVALTSSIMNASINKVELEVSSTNLIGSSCADFDVILVGDMLYDSVLSESIITWLKDLHFVSKKILVIGDPGRFIINSSSHPLSSNLCQLAKYELDGVTKEENYGFNQAHVFTFI